MQSRRRGLSGLLEDKYDKICIEPKLLRKEIDRKTNPVP